jgi:hypothetical protein
MMSLNAYKRMARWTTPGKYIRTAPCVITVAGLK